MKPIMCIISRSGSGKTTLTMELEKYGLKAIPSYTTRQPRIPDEQGHTFITEDEFDKLTDIIAYNKFDNHRYAVTKDMLENEQYSLYVIDLSGLIYLLDNYKGDRPIISIYIDCDVVDRFNHMVNRADDRSYNDRVKAALQRIEHDVVEFNMEKVKKNVNFIVKNREGNFNNLVGYVKRICENYGMVTND